MSSWRCATRSADASRAGPEIYDALLRSPRRGRRACRTGVSPRNDGCRGNRSPPGPAAHAPTAVPPADPSLPGRAASTMPVSVSALDDLGLVHDVVELVREIVEHARHGGGRARHNPCCDGRGRGDRSNAPEQIAHHAAAIDQGHRRLLSIAAKAKPARRGADTVSLAYHETIRTHPESDCVKPGNGMRPALALPCCGCRTEAI